MAAIIRPYQQNEVTRAVNPVPVQATTNSLGDLGAGLGAVGDMFTGFQDEIDTADAKTADSEYADLIRSELYADGTGFMYSQGSDSIGRRASVSERMEAEQKRILEGLNPGARSRASSSLTARFQRGLTSIDQHTSGQRQVYLDSASEARILSSVQDAIFSPDQVSQSLATSDQEISDLAARNGWAPEVTAARQIAARTAIHSGIVERMKTWIPLRPLNTCARIEIRCLVVRCRGLKGG